MSNPNNDYENTNVTNKQLYTLLLQLKNKVADLKKQIKPIKKQKNYNYKDASEILCITVGGLKTRIKRGKIKRITNDGKPMISHEEIQRFLSSQNPGMQNFGV